MDLKENYFIKLQSMAASCRGKANNDTFEVVLKMNTCRCCQTEDSSSQVHFEKGKDRICNHCENTFCANCSCPDCVGYRESIITVFANQLLLTDVWNVVRSIIRSYYMGVISPNIDRLDANGKNSVWQSDGCISWGNVQHYEMVSGRTELMKFILSTALLQADDGHQLLERLCYEAEFLMKKYNSCVVEKLTAPHCDNVAFKINYLLNGFDQICSISQKIESLLNDFQRSYLKKFNLTWTLIIKRMYQHWVFSENSAIAFECLLKLKNQIPTSDYLDILTKYLNYDNEMAKVKEEWKYAWKALNRHHMTTADMKRRERIRMLHTTFETLHSAVVNNRGKLNEMKNADNSEFDAVWRNTQNAIKNRWQPSDKSRLTASIRTSCCISCKALNDNHKKSCKCVTCVIAGPYFCSGSEKFLKTLCYECSVIQNAVQDRDCLPQFLSNLKSILKGKDEGDQLNHIDETEYHLGWGVFRDLEDRRTYPHNKILKSAFCNNCSRNECAVALKILNNEINSDLAKAAVLYYQIVPLSDEEMKKNIVALRAYLKKVFKLYGLIQSIEHPILKICLILCCSYTVNNCKGLMVSSGKLNFDEFFDINDGDLMLKRDFMEHLSLENSVNSILDSKRPQDSSTMTEDNEEYHHYFNFSGDCLESCSCSMSDKIVCQKHKKSSARDCQDKTQFIKKQMNLTSSENIDENMQFANQRSTNIANHKETQNSNTKNNSEAMKKLSSKKRCIDTWVKETLSYIEGSKKEKCINKKTEKRNRQKLKKEERKHVEELLNLKSQYQDLYFKEFQSKQELKSYKNVKKKDKKKILEIENNIKKLNSAKLKVERNILDLLHIVKSINTNFKLSYLPTKEEVEEALRKINDPVVPENNDTGPPIMDATIADTLHDCQEDIQDTFIQNSEVSKKIVTIRRVNVPHMAEPQVTVTAKGNSPKEDRLLYTFINGQIIPASSLDVQTLNLLTTRSPTALPKDLHPLLKNNDDCFESLKPKSCNNHTIVDMESYSLGGQQGNECEAGKNTIGNKNDCFKGKQHPISTPIGERTYLRVQKKQQLDTHANKQDRLFLQIDEKSNKESRETSAPNSMDSNLSNQPLCIDATRCNSVTSFNMQISGNKIKLSDQQKTSYVQLNVSIADQINKGIKVENLTLPPGITLTRVDPSKSEKINDRRESIEKLSFRMQCIENTPRIIHPKEINNQTHDSHLEYRPHQEKNQKLPFTQRKGKTHKYQKGGGNEKQEHRIDTTVTGRERESKNCCRETGVANMPNDSSMMMDHPATIIKKENGMFTIRSPALHHGSLPNSNGILSSLSKLHLSSRNEINGNRNSAGAHVCW